MSEDEAWRRIAAAATEGATELNLNGLGLTELPPELFDLQKLQILRLDDNQLTSLPELIGQLQNLQTLLLDNNQLTSLPKSIAQLHNLQGLNLDDNQLTSLPESITQLQKLQVLWLTSNQLTSLPELISQLQKLQYLLLENNQLTSLPGSITQLESLQYLSLHGNQLTSLPELIDQLQNLKRLDLDNNRLTSLPELISQLQDLEILRLHNNQLMSLPESISQLQNLQYLSLGNNQLTSLPESITQLQNLKILWLNNNQLTSIPESIGQLQNLQTLSLLRNQLTSIPESIGQLQNLQTLWLFRNQLTSVPESIGQLQNLQTLSLFRNQLTSIPESITQLQNLQVLTLGSNQLTSIPESITQLQNLQTLWLDNTQLTSLPESISQLQNLRHLLLGDNQLMSLPESITQLQNLQTLSLEKNQLTSIPEWLDRFPKLKEATEENWQKDWSGLSIGGNQIDEIPLSLVPFLKEVYNVKIEDNPYRAYPPEIVEQGQEAIFDYLDERCQGYEQKWISKLLIVGQGGAGKTCLLNALRGNEFDSKSDTTHGMEIGPLELPHPDRPDVTMTLSAWDFGGQEIYHATHQFFMSERSLFLLVWNARSGFEEAKLDYWLDTIQTLAPKAPVLLVATHTDQREAAFPVAAFQAKYPQLKAIAAVSNATNDRIADLRAELARLAADLPLMGEIWPTTWLQASQRLSNLDQAYLTPKAFYGHLAAAGVAAASRPVLARWLHELGQILFFQDAIAQNDLDLSDLVILRPDWASQTISRVIDDPEVEKRRGIFTTACMARLWDDLEPHICDHLLRLMERFDLSYRLTEDAQSDRSLVVERVPHDPPATLPEWTAIGPDTPTIRLMYHLSAVPAGIPTWFIARQSRFSTNQHWRYGAIFAYNDGGQRHLARLDLPLGSRALNLTVRGPHPQNFCTLLHDGITQLLADRFPGLVVTPKVLCPGHNGEPCTHEFDYQQLRTRKKPLIECPIAEEDHAVDFLLYGIDRRTEAQVMGRLETLTETVLGLSENLQGELRSLGELTQRNYTQDFAAEQSKVDNCCPTVFTIRPARSQRDRPETWKRSIIGQKLELQLYCQAPGSWHPVETCCYEITDAARWLKTLSPYLNRLVKILKFAAPLAGPIAGIANSQEYEKLQYDLEFTSELANQLPQLSAADLGADWGEEASRWAASFDRDPDPETAEGRRLYALRQFLKEKEPLLDRGSCGKGDLCLVKTPEYHWLWLCPHHRQAYLGRETYPHAIVNPFTLDEEAEQALFQSTQP